MIDFFERAGLTRSLVVLLDDLQWADESTLLLLLQQLAPHLEMLVLGTYRDVELDLQRPFAQVLETLSRQRLAKRITVRRLPEAGVREMLVALGGPSPPPTLVSSIFAETEGNPSSSRTCSITWLKRGCCSVTVSLARGGPILTSTTCR